MEDNFNFDSEIDVPSREEINETLVKMEKPKKKNANLPKNNQIQKQPWHPMLKGFILCLTLIILIGGGVMGYKKLTGGDSSFGTGATIGLSKVSSTITGMFVGTEPLPENEKFGFKILEREINLLTEETTLQNSIKADMLTKCVTEKNDVKVATETKMTTKCENEKALIQEESDSWKEKYDNCQDSE